MLEKGICLLLSLLLVVSMAACGGQSETPATELTTVAATETVAETVPESLPQPTESEPPTEMERALALGFADEAMLQKLDAPISFAAYTTVLDRLVEITMPERMEQWQERSHSFRDWTEEMSRIEGAVAMFYAAECLGADTIGLDYQENPETKLAPDMEFWYGAFNPLPRIEGCLDLYQSKALETTMYNWRGAFPYVNNAGWFVLQESFGSGKTYFEYNEDYMMDFEFPFTYEMALQAVVRFYDTLQFLSYVPADQVQCSISPEDLAAGAALPAASEQALPDWHGFSIPNRKWGAIHVTGMYYQEEEIRAIAAQGFNFVRVPLDGRDFFPGEDYTLVNPEYLKNLDQLIGWCAQNGIHVCIDLHDMAGFNTGGETADIDLFTNSLRAQQFAQIWQFFARYYKEVSPNLLSFNLLNEPHGNGYTDASYAKVMIPAIEAIRAENPSRVIVADMLDWFNGTPSQTLVPTGVVQSWHPYLVMAGSGFQSWPLENVDADTLAQSYGALAAFREETGIQVMAQELGFSSKVPQEAAYGAFNDLLYVLDSLDIPWCSWCGDFGPLLNAQTVELQQSQGQDDMRRPGSTYASVSENWIVDEGLMKIFQSYMDS